MVERFREFVWQRAKGGDWWLIFKIGLALGLMGAVVAQLNWQDLNALWQRMDLWWLAPTLVLFFAILWATARRVWYVVGPGVPFRAFLSIVILQSVLANLFSLVVGTAYFVALLRARYRIELRRGIGAVIFARWGDLIFWLPVLMLASVSLWAQLGKLQWVVLGLCGVLAVFVFGVWFALLARRPLLAWTRWCGKPFARWRVVNKLLDATDRLAAADGAVLRRMALEIIVTSVAVGGFTLVYIYSHARLFAIPLPFVTIVFVTVIGLLISFLPIQVFGGLGVYEFSTVFLYELFGLRVGEAIPLVLGTRVLLLLMNALTLLYVPLELRWSRRQERAAADASQVVAGGDIRLDSTARD